MKEHKRHVVMGHVVMAALLSAALFALACLQAGAARAAEPVKIVMLGDSITKGVRSGVQAEETFAAIVEADLAKRGIAAKVINSGIGGETTDRALARLESTVLVQSPRLVVVMYGTNDSYIDKGKAATRLTLEEYQGNLGKLIDQISAAGAIPIVMTPPCWGAEAGANGAGEHPNRQLEKFAAACRELAARRDVALVDHYAHWVKAEQEGQDLSGWTTDECHPNPAGHRVMAELMIGVLLRSIDPRD